MQYKGAPMNRKILGIINVFLVSAAVTYTASAMSLVGFEENPYARETENEKITVRVSDLVKGTKPMVDPTFTLRTKSAEKMGNSKHAQISELTSSIVMPSAGENNHKDLTAENTPEKERFETVRLELNEYPNVMISVSSLEADSRTITFGVHKDTYLFNEMTKKVWILVLHGMTPEWREIETHDHVVKERLGFIFKKGVGRNFF